MGRARPRPARHRGTAGPQRRRRRALLHHRPRLRVRRGALLRAAQADDLPGGARRHPDHDRPPRRGAARARRRGNPTDLALPLRFERPRARRADALDDHAPLPARTRGTGAPGLRGMSPRITELERQLEELHAELARAQNLDPKSRELLAHVRSEIESALARSQEPAPGTLRERLEAAIAHFETTHPVLTATMGRVIDQLANLGI